MPHKAPPGCASAIVPARACRAVVDMQNHEVVEKHALFLWPACLEPVIHTGRRAKALRQTQCTTAQLRRIRREEQLKVSPRCLVPCSIAQVIVRNSLRIRYITLRRKMAPYCIVQAICSQARRLQSCERRARQKAIGVREQEPIARLQRGQAGVQHCPLVERVPIAPTDVTHYEFYAAASCCLLRDVVAWCCHEYQARIERCVVRQCVRDLRTIDADDDTFWFHLCVPLPCPVNTLFR